MLKLISVLFAVFKKNYDYDVIVNDSLLTIKEIIETLEEYHKYFKYDWTEEFIRLSDEGYQLIPGYALVRRAVDDKPVAVGKVERIYDRPE